MKIVNFAAASVDTTGGTGGTILSADAAKAGLAVGMEYVSINPSVDIRLVDPTGGTAYPNIPGAIAGTIANSPFICPAGVPTMVRHRGGEIRGISSSGTATVLYALSVGD
jgi:hypothetical protein